MLEMADRVMNRVVCERRCRGTTRAEHRRHGVNLVLGARMSPFVGDQRGRVTAVRCADGRRSCAPISWWSASARAGTGPARARRGPRLRQRHRGRREYCRTSDPRFRRSATSPTIPSLRYGYRVRLESVDNAFEQANHRRRSASSARRCRTTRCRGSGPTSTTTAADRRLARGRTGGAARRSGDAQFRPCPPARRRADRDRHGQQRQDQMAARKLIAARVRADPRTRRCSSAAAGHRSAWTQPPALPGPRPATGSALGRSRSPNRSVVPARTLRP